MTFFMISSWNRAILTDRLQFGEVAMKNPIYLNHDYLTRDGHKVNIVQASTGEWPYPVTGLIVLDNGDTDALVWTRTGCFDKDVRNHPYDLVKDVTGEV